MCRCLISGIFLQALSVGAACLPAVLAVAAPAQAEEFKAAMLLPGSDAIAAAPVL